MQKVLVLQHVPHEGLGIIGRELYTNGLQPEYLKVYEGHEFPFDVSGYSALIVLGGPMGVYEDDKFPFIAKELKLIRSALKDNLPILGICLGAQMLAKAAGAEVYKGGKKEIGWYEAELTEEGEDDRLFLGLPRKFTVFQWHGDTFDVPANGLNLVSSELFPNQVIKAGPRAYGIQFHLEVTEEMIKSWIKENSGELEALKGKIDPDAIIKEIPLKIPDLHRLGHTVLSRFIRLID